MKPNAGFTLLEVMLAVMIGVIVLMSVGVTLTGIMRQKRVFESYAALNGEAEVIEKTLKLTVWKAIASGLTFEETNKFNVITEDGTYKIYTQFDRTENGVTYYDLISTRGEGTNKIFQVISDYITYFSATNQAYSRSGVAIDLKLQDPNRPSSEIERDLYIGIRNDDVGGGTAAAARGLDPIEEVVFSN